MCGTCRAVHTLNMHIELDLSGCALVMISNRSHFIVPLFGQDLTIPSFLTLQLLSLPLALSPQRLLLVQVFWEIFIRIAFCVDIDPEIVCANWNRQSRKIKSNRISNSSRYGRRSPTHSHSQPHFTWIQWIVNLQMIFWWHILVWASIADAKVSGPQNQSSYHAYMRAIVCVCVDY